MMVTYLRVQIAQVYARAWTPRSLVGTSSKVNVKENGEWVEQEVSLSRDGMSYLEYIKKLKEVRGPIAKHLLHEGKQQLKVTRERAAVARLKKFNSKKKGGWLRGVLGKFVKPIVVSHCWEVGVEGFVELVTDPVRVAKAADSYFYEWTRATTERDDKIVEEVGELEDQYCEANFKEEALWHAPTESHPLGDPQFMTVFKIYH